MDIATQINCREDGSQTMHEIILSGISKLLAQSS